MSAPSDTPRLFDATVRIDRLPAAGREVRLAPDAAERAAIAAFLELTELPALEVEMAATPFRGGIRVQGRLRGMIVQPSVVSLEPVTQEIDEPIDRVFLPGVEDPHAGPSGQEVFVDLEADDLPDPLEGPEADLSDLVIETLALAIDPYPRAEGESLEGIEGLDDEPLESPFAALKSLKSPGAKED
jgi:uncharacterized metal-binding protein YceD (DUF177 family)